MVPGWLYPQYILAGQQYICYDLQFVSRASPGKMENEKKFATSSVQATYISSIKSEF